jgi:hypothetical protein
MRPGSNARRLRGRGNGRKHPSGGRNQTFESNGPDVKVRGSAQQVVEKYLALARDASSTGDRIMAENYFQHAEHYLRLLNSIGGTFEPRGDQFHGNGGMHDHGREGDDDQPMIVPQGHQPMADRGDGPRPVAPKPEQNSP